MKSCPLGRSGSIAGSLYSKLMIVSCFLKAAGGRPWPFIFSLNEHRIKEGRGKGISKLGDTTTLANLSVFNYIVMNRVI